MLVNVEKIKVILGIDILLLVDIFNYWCLICVL